LKTEKGVSPVVATVIMVVVAVLAAAMVVTYMGAVKLPERPPNTDIEITLYDRGLPAKDRIMVDLISGDYIDFSKVEFQLENKDESTALLYSQMGPHAWGPIISPRAVVDHLKPGVEPEYYLENMENVDNLPGVGTEATITIGENRYDCVLTIEVENRGGTQGPTITSVTGDEDYNIYVTTYIAENLYLIARFYDNIGDVDFNLNAGDTVTVRLIHLPSKMIFFERDIVVITY
jgi:flagellin-like protein